MMVKFEFDEILPSFISAEEVPERLAGLISEGKWDEVISMYEKSPMAHTAKMEDYNYEGTALHVAVDMDEVGVAQDLLRAILKPVEMVEGERILALETGNKDGDTPLHYAASRGITQMCEEIIGRNNERMYLASQKNKHGETPLFQAAINGRKQAFAYLSTISNNTVPLQDLLRNDRDTVLHCAIRNEYFDLAVIILHYYEFLSTIMNKDGEYPVKLLATRPSAFKSSTYLSFWKRILYHCIHVQPLDPGSAMAAILAKIKKRRNSDEENYPKNYTVLIAAFTALSCGKLRTQKNQPDPENPSNTIGFLPPNYETIHQFVRYPCVLIMGLLGQDIKEVRNIKKKHQWGGQLFKALMKRPDAAFTGSGGVPTDIDIDLDMYNVYSQWKQGETSDLGWLKKEKEEQIHLSQSDQTIGKKNDDLLKGDKKMFDKKETAFFAAARNGIVEMVNEILYQNPMVIRETNSCGDNVLLVAVRNRKPQVVKSLEKKLLPSKPEVWKTLTLALDKNGKTLLHLAAEAPAANEPWQISGAALQMMWDVNWYQYIKSLVPQHYYFKQDNDQKIPREVFKEKHKELRKESSEWLRETSESCSVVAALVAGASFATAATVPGGTNDKGIPHLENMPAFEAFVIASLIGLCFSVTGLIMFLTILTSRKLHRDFRKDLPLKLLLGLSSLFVSIVALVVSFCTGHSFLFIHKYKMLILPIYVATCFPVTFYAVAQLPLYFDLLPAISFNVPQTSDEGDSL